MKAFNKKIIGKFLLISIAASAANAQTIYGGTNNNTRSYYTPPPLIENSYDAARRREAERFETYTKAPMPSYNGYDDPLHMNPSSQSDRAVINNHSRY